MESVTPAKRDILFKVAATSGAWVSRAYQLHTAAKALFKLYIREHDHYAKRDDPESNDDRRLRRTFKYLTISQVILMLAGLAIENLTKALWTKENKPSPNGRLPDVLKRHDRNVELLKSMSVPLSKDEIALVRLLERCVVWSGRYPIPKRAEDMALPKDFGRAEFQLFNGLYERLRKRTRR